MKQNDSSSSIVYKRFSLLPCIGSFRLHRSSATIVTTATTTTDPDATIRHHLSRGIKGSLKRIFRRNQLSTTIKKPATTTTYPQSITASKKNDTSSMTSPMSIASRTLHTIPLAPPTTTYDDDIRFDSGGKGDPEPYFMFNTFGPLDEVEETSHENGASNDNNSCKGDIQDPSLKTKAMADCEINFHATTVETKDQQQQQQSNSLQDQQEEQPKDNASLDMTTHDDSTHDAKESAQHIWDENGVIVPKEHAAEWLGGRSFINQDALHYYMDKFDFGNMRLDEAIRKLCSKLYLKAETQQIDRILHVFASRYWRCNQDCVLQSADVVYAVAYSLVLLNTDLHVAQGNYTRMTRHEFVRNTMDAIQDHQSAPLSPIRESQLQSYLKQIYVSVKHSQIMQPIQRHPSFCSTTAEGENNNTDNRAIRSMRSLGSIIRNARREPISPTRLTYGGGDSCATSCLSSSTPASPSQSTFSIKVMSEQISFSNDPPLIKEGLVRRKHLFESSDRKAKNREWRRCLLIVNDGQLKIYQWRQASSGDIGCKGSSIHRGNSVNSTAAIPRSSGSDEKGWDACFRLLGCFPLNHTLTHVLPSPGYDRRRAHVFAVQFPDGGVYLFQTSSRIQCKEWAATCNYWAARKSKQPLAGGVCNIEYGWGACLDDDDDSDPDSILLCEWHPPASPLISSTFDEQDQHMTIKRHLTLLSQELDTHNQVKCRMLRKFPSRYANHAKAMHNWEVKSRYLLQDIIKYESYCDALEKGIQKQHESLAAT